MTEPSHIHREFHHLDRVPVGACLLDREFTVLYWNALLETWTGCRRGQIVGRPIDEVFPHLAQPMYRGRFETVLLGGPPAVFSSQLHPYILPAPLSDGSFRRQQAMLVSVEVPENSGNLFGLLVVEDVTDLVRRIEEYRHMRDQAQQEANSRRRVEQELREAHALLEEKVRRRTADLVASNHAIRSEMAERKRTEQDLLGSQRQTERMLTSLASLLVGVDAGGNVVRWNASAAECLGLAPEEVLGRRLWDCPAGWDQPVVRQAVNTCQAGHHTVRLDDVSYDRPDGTRGILELIVSPVRDEDEGGVVLLGRDISHQRLVESQLAQAQKLEAMGQLAAGIAHEINTPTQYVGDNTRFLQEALADLGQMLAKLGGAVCKVPESADPADTLKELADLWEQLDVGYLLEEMPKAVEQSLEGIQRVTQIVRAMKEFSHPQRDEMTPVDLNHAIESTVTICRNEWKYVAELDVQLDPALPPVTCLAGQVNQVILNLIINAAHAIEDRAGREDGRKGRIVVSTRPCDEQVEIRISDNGCGISPEAKDRIFDLFFTTKPTGRGTGQGLAIARATIEERHGGTIDVESVEGEGTTFTLRLPLSGRDDRSSDKSDPPKEHAHA